MGKSKKHAVEVPEPKNVVSGVVKKKGKRALEEVVENKSSKKQKKIEKIAAGKKKQLSVDRAPEFQEEQIPEVAPKTKGARTLQAPAKKVHAEQIIEEESSDEDEVNLPGGKALTNNGKAAQSDTSEEDSELEEEMKPVKPPPKVGTKSGAVLAVSKAKLQPAKGAGVKNGKGDESSSEDESSDSDEEPVKAPAKNTKDGGAFAASKAKLQPAKAAAVKGVKGVGKQESSSEDDSSESDEDSGNHTSKPGTKAGAVLAASKAKLQPAKGVAGKNGKSGQMQESSSEEDTSDSDEEPVPKVAKPSLKPALKKMEVSDEEDDSEDSEEDDSDEPDAVPNTKKPSVGPKAKEVRPVAKPSAKMESSSEETSEDESDEETTDRKQKVELKTSPAAKVPTKGDSDSDDESDSGEELTQNPKQVATPARISTDGGTKTVFVKNLPWAVDEDTVRDFFQDAGEIHDVRLAMGADGRFRGFGHIEFTSEEAAKKACEKTGQLLAGRDVFVDLAQERAFTPSSGGKQDWKSPRGGGFSGSANQRSSSDATAFVRGFDKFQDEDSIRGSLTEFFNDCGGVKSIRIPTDRETGDIKGFAYIDFEDKTTLSKALEYNGSDINGRYLTIEEAGTTSGGGGRGRGGDFGGRGGRGGRGRGDFGDRGRGGRRGGRGGRGFGMPREKVNLSGSGKKTTFGDD